MPRYGTARSRRHSLPTHSFWQRISPYARAGSKGRSRGAPCGWHAPGYLASRSLLSQGRQKRCPWPFLYRNYTMIWPLLRGLCFKTLTMKQKKGGEGGEGASAPAGAFLFAGQRKRSMLCGGAFSVLYFNMKEKFCQVFFSKIYFWYFSAITCQVCTTV